VRHGRVDHLADRALVSEARAALDWSTHLVITTPADNTADRAWAEDAVYQQLPVVHLGRRKADPGIWQRHLMCNTRRYFDLDDVFNLRTRQNTLRTLQLHRARRACDKLAADSEYNHSRPTAQTAVA